MQIWCDIYTWGAKVYKWRIVIDTVRNLFVVLDSRDRVTKYHNTTVAKRGDVYYVSDVPTRYGVAGNIVLKVNLMTRTVEILGGGGGFKHVVYADGWKIAEKPYGARWTRVVKRVPPPNPLALPKLLMYAILVRTKVYR